MLVTLEGIDGAGKSSLWEALHDEFEDAVFTREPTQDTFYGEAVYESLSRDSADSLAELFLYTADHAAHLDDTIHPAVGEGELVISDRYSDSRYAYQAQTLTENTDVDYPLEYIQGIHREFTYVPDLTLYLDIDPEVSVKRSDQANKFEQLEYLRGVADNYETLIEQEPERFVRINAEQSPEAVLQEAVMAIRSEWADRNQQKP